MTASQLFLDLGVRGVFVCPFDLFVQNAGCDRAKTRRALFHHISENHKTDGHWICPLCSTLPNHVLAFTEWLRFEEHLCERHYPQQTAARCRTEYEEIYCPYIPCAPQGARPRLELQRHIEKDHRQLEGRYICPKCIRTLHSIKELHGHLGIVHGAKLNIPPHQEAQSKKADPGRKLKCYSCDRDDFADEAHRQIHWFTVHAGKTTKCWILGCGLNFGSQDKLREHIEWMHHSMCLIELADGGPCTVTRESMQDMLEHHKSHAAGCSHPMAAARRQ